MIGVVNYSSVRNHVTHTLSGSVGGVEFQSPDSGSIFNSRTAGAVTTSSSGGNQPHNNMPPYYTLCYIMKMTPDETDGGVAFTTDSTLTMSDDSVLGVTTPVNTILTQTEYDALPEAQRNKGMYVIPEEGDSGGSSGGGATNDVYSTEETRIGTWINGKPLYRRVFTANLIENSNIVLLTPEECSIIESMPLTRGSVMYNGKTMYLPYYLVESTTTEITKINAYCDVTFAPQRRGLLISTMGSFLSSTDIIANVIIEYTKTTD